MLPESIWDKSIIIDTITERFGMSIEDIELELKRRRSLLEWLVKEDIRRYDAVGRMIREYYADPERLYQKVHRELE